MNDLLEYAKVYRGVATTIDEAMDKVKEITDQLAWVIDDNDELDIYIGGRDKRLYQYDGYKYYYLVKVQL